MSADDCLLGWNNEQRVANSVQSWKAKGFLHRYSPTRTILYFRCSHNAEAKFQAARPATLAVLVPVTEFALRSGTE